MKGIHKYWMKQNNGETLQKMSLQWASIKKVSWLINFWKKSSYTFIIKRHVRSKDAEKEINEEEEEFQIVSETLDKTESEEYDSGSLLDVLPVCENISVASSLSQNDQKMHFLNFEHNKTKTSRRKTTNCVRGTLLSETLF